MTGAGERHSAGLDRCGHSPALVTSTWTLAVADAPCGSVAVKRAT